MIYIGIDPGKNGGIAVIDYDKAYTYKYDNVKLIQLLDDFNVNNQKVKCMVENVHAMPGQGVTSMFNFGKNFGFIQGALSASFIQYELVSPQKWKREFGVTKDKNTSIDCVIRLFPSVNLLPTERSRKPHDGMAEALLIAEYARRHMK